MPDLLQNISWPGAFAVEGFSASIGHGISPSTFVLIIQPQPSLPAAYGDLVINDGIHGNIVFRNCKVDRITSSTTGGGTVWRLEILDRRWRWAFGRIDGTYNELDPRGKLTPYYIQSAAELARMCLDAMGERGYVIDLPPGLPAAAGQNIDRLLRAGENFPQTLANPQVNWDVTPPAQALAQIAERFGRRVVYQPLADRVVVVPPTSGITAWPNDWPAEVISPTLDDPEAPIAVGVAGAPIRFQCRLPLEAVGEEWDGSYVPINELSYAPSGTAQPQITQILMTGTGGYQITVKGKTQQEADFYGAADTAINVATNYTAYVNGNATLQTVCTATNPSDGVVILTGVNNKEFTVTAEESSGGGSATAFDEQVAIDGAKSWANDDPDFHTNVKATDRLTYFQAQDLANRSVMKCYRIKDDPILDIPGYGKIKRRQQIILQPTKVEQVVPAAPDPLRIDGDGQPRLANFYSGYSRDQPATVAGSVSKSIAQPQWVNQRAANTDPDGNVYLAFETNAEEQMIRFGVSVYAVTETGQIKPPDLILETGVLIRDEKTGQVKRYERTLPISGGTAPVEWAIFGDVQFGVVGRYDDNGRPLGANFFADENNDAIQRANNYLQAMALRYQGVAGETRRFIGLFPIEPSGTVQQVSWEIGPNGPSTTATIGGEHEVWIPDYGARRKDELLAAVAAKANRAGEEAKPGEYVSQNSK